MKFTIFAERPVEVYRKCDIGLLISIILMWGLGLLTLYASSANYALRTFQDQFYFIKRQLLLSVVGWILFILFASVKISFIKKILPTLVIGTVILCLLPFVPGFSTPRNGAHRWILIPFIGETFQPSELGKLALVLFLANWFDKNQVLEDSQEKPSLLNPIIGLAVFVGIIMAQDDFSTALFMFAIGLLMFYMAGVKLGKTIPFIILAIFGMLIFVFSSSFRVNRLIAFINPSFDTHGYNYQTDAARSAISAGGFLGQGFGSGLEKINRVPEIQTDYIFAGWVEAMGFVGVIGYFILVLFFAWRAYRASYMCKTRFTALVGFGCTSCIFLQSLANCGVVCGALPATGITLPFYSSGGSSLLVSFCICGLLINISRSNGEEEYVYEETYL